MGIIGIRKRDYDDIIMHSAKGTTWSDHKYIAIKNGRYIYPEDVRTKPDEKIRNRNDRLLLNKAKIAENRTKDNISAYNFVHKYTNSGIPEEDFVKGEKLGAGDARKENDDNRRKLYLDLGFTDREAELLTLGNSLEESLNKIDNPEATERLMALLSNISTGHKAAKAASAVNKMDKKLRRQSPYLNN